MTYKMEIENIRYSILSQGKDKPEKRPTSGEIFSLAVRSASTTTTDLEAKIAIVRAENVLELGTIYCQVLGMASIDNAEELPCNASYAIDGEYEEGQVIGELRLKKVKDYLG